MRVLDANEIMESVTIDLGTVPAYHKLKGNKEVSSYMVEWTIKNLPSPIVGYKPDCGCTANLRSEGNKIIAKYTPGATGKITKHIKVFLDDDQPLMVEKDGNSFYNVENKTHFVITVTGHYV